jgi:hypothetical protein
MAYGFVYVVYNESMPELYKIGYTNRSPLERCRELSDKTSVPTQFKIYCYGEIENPSDFERKMHEAAERFRVNSSREFFKIPEDSLLKAGLWIKELCIHFVGSDLFYKLKEKLPEVRIDNE